MSHASILRAFRRVKYRKIGKKKYQPVFQKKAPYNIFIIKSQNLKMRGVKILGVLIRFTRIILTGAFSMGVKIFG